VSATARVALSCWLASMGASASERAVADPQLAPRIVNGLVAWDPPSVGALLCGVDRCLPEFGEPTPRAHLNVECSGTLIGCRTFLTAAHCVCELPSATACHEGIPRDPSNYRVFFQHAGLFEVESLRVHPDFNFASLLADVAVVRLVEPVPGIPPAVLNDVGTPAFGTPGTIVGFGQPDSGPAVPTRGVKRSGSVVTADCSLIPDAGHVCWHYEEPLGPPGSDSNTCFGDSGGPLFADLGEGPALAGVTSHGDSSGCGPPEQSDDEDVYWWLDFIVAEAGADLGTTCGETAPVGHPRSESFEFSGSLSEQKAEEHHAFEVAAGAALLRVALNAQPKAGASDFDLYLKLGSPPTPSDFDCAVADATQFGACEMPAPAAGSWHVRVERVAGDAEYQVTAVAAPEPGPIALFVTGAAVLAASRASRKLRRR
jgi:Trypsin